MNVEFDYSVGQQVKVKAVEMLGRVDSLSLDNNGKMYRVVYWNDGSRCQVWMYDWEIEPCGTSTANIGSDASASPPIASTGLSGGDN